MMSPSSDRQPEQMRAERPTSRHSSPGLQHSRRSDRSETTDGLPSLSQVSSFLSSSSRQTSTTATGSSILSAPLSSFTSWSTPARDENISSFDGTVYTSSPVSSPERLPSEIEVDGSKSLQQPTRPRQSSKTTTRKALGTSEKRAIYAASPLSTPRSIRVLQLLPASSREAPLHAELGVVELDTQVSFESLSYTWGEPFEGQRLANGAIKLSNRLIENQSNTIEITGNLDHALRRLRYRGQARSLWVDALCIDQKDDSERGYQIEIMEHIYSQARRVVVWLGEDSANKRGDGEYFFEFCRIIERHGGLRPHYKAIEAYKARWPDYKTLSKLFATRRYFRRLWVVQELCHARDVTFMCGTRSASLATFTACAHALPASRRSMDTVKELCTNFGHLRQALADWNERLQTAQVSTLSDLIWILQQFHNFRCGDDRDRLYAIASLWKSESVSTADIISPNYLVSCERLYSDFAVRFINAHNTNSQAMSRFLCIASDQACNSRFNSEGISLPSWVVDWRLSPAPRIGSDDVAGNISLSEPLDLESSCMLLRTRCFGAVAECAGHYRDLQLLTMNGLIMPSFCGQVPDEEYVSSLGRLCRAFEVGDMLCHPVSTYRGRRRHVADAAIVLRRQKSGHFRIVGRAPLDLFWEEAEGDLRTTESIATYSVSLMIE